MTALIEMMRPKQWTKNLLVFAALIFTGNLLNLLMLNRTLAAFGLFCLATSAIYLLNDILDLAQDRKHPEKAKRPLARGAVTANAAGATAALLGCLALAGGFWLDSGFGFLVAGYLGLFVLYSLFLKHMVI